MTANRIKIAAVAVGAVLLLFMWAVWPTPYRYEKLPYENSNEINKYKGEHLVRINRITGTVETWSDREWK